MSMKVIVCESYEDMSRRAAKIFAETIVEKPTCVLGFATGSTPLGMYNEFIRMHKEEGLDFSRATSFNLDEYYPISPDNDQSYRYFMEKNLFEHINIPASATHVPNGSAIDAEAECAAYDKMIEDFGGIDIQVLGIGVNGHIAFNEPDDALVAATHVTTLTDSTVEANSRFFASENDVPKQAITMGMGTILKARAIVCLITGKDKNDVVKQLLTDKIDPMCPATFLKLHSNVTILCDEDAYNG